MNGKKLILVGIFLLTLTISFAQKSIYFNPILPGFYPDPSICRVGNDYYLVNSTFAYFPGVPIFHSTDLVHWKQIGNVLSRPEQLNLDGHGVSRGIFAPNIHYHDGVFYMITTLIDTGGNFVVTATDPAGPWSNPVFLPQVQGIDPSLFFDDDGKAYVIFNSDPPDRKPLWNGHRALWMYEFDKKSLSTVGEIRLVVDGGVDVSKHPVWIEGPHIYKIKDHYYLMAAEGGTGYNHSEVIFRAKNLHEKFIPWEKNPILTQRHLDPSRKYAITTTGHADIVETQNGEWWAVFLACRPYETGTKSFYNVGRETFLAPVKWTSDGWPVITQGNDLVKYQYPAPNLPPYNAPGTVTGGNFTATEDFNQDKLDFAWLFLRTPRENWNSLSDKKGWLTMKTRPATITGRENPSFLARRQQHLYCEMATTLQFTPANEDELAGMAAFQNEGFHYLIAKKLIDGKPAVTLMKSVAKDKEISYETINSVTLSKAESAQPLHLKIEARGGLYDFFYGTKAGKWIALKKDVDGKYLSTEVAQGFVGTTIGLYTTSNGKPSSNIAAFDNFVYTGKDPVYNDKTFLDRK